MNIKRLFGQSVSRCRHNLMISQEKLSEIAGLHRTYIGDIERGERNVSLINIVKIAIALKTTPSDLLSNIKPNELSENDF